MTAAVHIAPTHPSNVVLRDGSTVQVRPLLTTDEDELRRFFASLSMRSLAFRFFSAGIREQTAARRALNLDWSRSCGLVALHGRRIVGHAMYAAIDQETVEVAFVVADDMQGRGLGTVLLARIAETAEARGFEFMEAEVLPQNRRMLGMLRNSGFPFELRAVPGAVRARSPVSLSEVIHS